MNINEIKELIEIVEALMNKADSKHKTVNDIKEEINKRIMKYEASGAMSSMAEFAYSRESAASRVLSDLLRWIERQ